MRYLALMAAIAAGLVMVVLIVDWREFGRPDLIGIFAVLAGALLACVFVPQES